MTKKERTIRACRQLAAKYREPGGEFFFAFVACDLCLIHGRYSTVDGNCYGCPLSIGEDEGCYGFKSFQKASTYFKNRCGSIESNPAFESRAAFFDKIIPILEKIPASRFTKKGWKYFDELDRSW